MNENKKAWCSSLKKAIDDSGKSRYYFSKELGIKHNTLSNYYNGRNFPSVENYEKINKLFKL